MKGSREAAFAAVAVAPAAAAQLSLVHAASEDRLAG